MNVPADLKYTTDHEWVRVEGDTAVVGITEYAADALGDVVYLELPEVGDKIQAGQPCGEIESTKSVSDLLAPGDAEVLDVNSDAVNNSGLVNSDPYGDGWLIRITIDGTADLLDATQYVALIGAES